MARIHRHLATDDDEDFGSTGKSMWDETYLDPIQVPIGPVMRARGRNSKTHLLD
ncbi:hypothetical protein TIFTF001_020604 [Ficus carica]|uniref:Uncharacterized protein n=1 Tax=Ficus carica TaxID=3494 RepID=A0AA88DDT6_FICCA|nr:hypothetical protein TIFTF001_020604 [Ficus carica]